jgi:hypothetical protein
MQSGPSREELSNYFKNSRQYFDELAQHYKDTDPEYYREFIEPFYRNPFYSGSSNQKGCGLRFVFISIALVMIGGIALIVFFVIQQQQESDNNEFRIKEYKSDTIKSDEIQLDNIDSVLVPKDFKSKDIDDLMRRKQQIEKELNKKNKKRNK